MPRHQLHNWLIYWCLLSLITRACGAQTLNHKGRTPSPPQEREGAKFHSLIVLTKHRSAGSTSKWLIITTRPTARLQRLTYAILCCRRKQYDSSARSIEAAATTSQSQRAPCDRCAGWVIPIPATLCWLCWSDQYILINFTRHQSITQLPLPVCTSSLNLSFTLSLWLISCSLTRHFLH